MNKNPKEIQKPGPYGPFPTSEDEDYCRCPKCGHKGTDDDFDVCGADPDKLFCNHCGEEVVAEVHHSSESIAALQRALSKPAAAEKETASKIQARHISVTIRQAVARGWCHPETHMLEMDARLATAIGEEVATAICPIIDRQALEIKALQAANQMFVEYEKRVEKQLEAKDAAIKAALRIKTIWLCPSHPESPEAIGECKALDAMAVRFEQALKGDN